VLLINRLAIASAAVGVGARPRDDSFQNIPVNLVNYSSSVSASPHTVYFLRFRDSGFIYTRLFRIKLLTPFASLVGRMIHRVVIRSVAVFFCLRELTLRRSYGNKETLNVVVAEVGPEG